MTPTPPPRSPPSRSAPLFGGGDPTHGGATGTSEDSEPIPVGDGVPDPAATGTTGATRTRLDRVEHRCSELDTHYAQLRSEVGQHWFTLVVFAIAGGLVVAMQVAETALLGWLLATR